MSKVQRFSDEVLIGLLRALRARSASHPDAPWLVACWPGIQEEQMAAACGELIRRGHPIKNVPLAGRRRGAARSGWAVATEGRSARADAGRRPDTSCLCAQGALGPDGPRSAVC